ncbi:MAG: prolyl oligopeptidase family serine peptidase [Candidatus Eremiobacteraeota bacterium]|nr:prolyl oligopeptidase family serine peptidase [Candidatus Eremiobacteraeota bacterium]
MKKLTALLLTIAIVSTFPALAFGQSSRLQYPDAERGNVSDTYFGTRVADPYRWLEDLDSAQTRAWVTAQAALSASYFAAIPERPALYRHIKGIANYERIGAPYHVKNHYFYTYNSGLQNQSVLYTMDGPHGKPRVLIDPNKLSTDGTVALGPTAVNEDGTRIAYATQSAGSDWETWHVRSVATAKDTSDTIDWSKFSGASWLKDGSGFYYSRYAAPVKGSTYKTALYGQRVYFHTIGSPQSADRLVYEDPAHNDYFFSADVTEDGRYVILSQSGGKSYNTRIYYKDVRKPGSAFLPLLARGDAQYNFVDNAGSTFFIETDKDAPNHRLIAVDVANPSRARTVIPEASSALQGVSTVGNQFFAHYLQDAHSAVKQYTRSGRLVRVVALPGIGTAGGFSGQREDRSVYYTFSSYTSPPVTYRYDLTTGTSAAYRKTHVAFKDSQYVTDEVFYRSKDGTRVPMMIAHRKGLRLDGSNPTILYAYGGFDIAITPSFSTNTATWLQMGGIYAVANLRGGSEYGEAWHHAGMLEHKQRVFDDYIAAAQYLIAKGYTSTPKLAAKGESNGGLLIGAVETQRPDLFGVALPGVGVLDMLRFQDFTIGNAWISEYGCSTCSKDQFETLLRYSPYHNVKDGTHYPPTLISTADHDDRVFPAHSFKFAAAMQRAQAGEAPVLLRVDTRSGHGGGKPITKVVEDYADIYAFLVKNMHLSLPSGF